MFHVVYPFLLLLQQYVPLYFLLPISLLIRVYSKIYPGTGIPEEPILAVRHVEFLSDTLPARLDDFIIGILVYKLYPKHEFNNVRYSLLIGLAWGVLGCWIWDYVNLGYLPSIILILCNTCFQISTTLMILSLNNLEIPRIQIIERINNIAIWILLLHGIAIERFILPYRFKDTIPVYVSRCGLGFGVVFLIAGLTVDGNNGRKTARNRRSNLKEEKKKTE